ncbi:phosphate-starvation-inducible PsiE family protein [Thiohalorhabdus sp.]|uniref:phosphate-starvation-inducible PsiE family protein n=1 Tax=Thiohalorhabdus sp. TaxID=3094134 RepID=UPI002FC2B7D2
MGWQRTWQELRSNWRLMTLYERFEQVVAVVLVVAIAAVVLVALWNLMSHILRLVVSANLNPQNHKLFLRVFSGNMTLLIAMEFKHSILRWAVREESIIQVKTVLVIAILALARKFIILDTEVVSAPHLFGLSVAVLALGGVYWLMRERDDHLPASDKKARRGAGRY